MRLNSIYRFFVFTVVIFSMFTTLFSGAKTGDGDVLLTAMQEEMSRSMKVLGEKGTPPPYFMCYQIIDSRRTSLSASFGALRSSGGSHSRTLDMDVRVGDQKLDNTHTIRGRRYGSGSGYAGSVPVSLEDDPDAIKNIIWLETDKRYKDAVERLIQIKANKSVSVKEEDQSDDFSKETPQQYIGEPASISPDIETWKAKVREYSALFSGFPEIHRSTVSLNATTRDKYFVNSEGTVLRHGRTHWRLGIHATTKAEDGMQLFKVETFDVGAENELPDDEKVKTVIRELIDGLLALRTAPPMEPYTGPAILSGRASAVFFHEIFGHRIEGHRQKDEKEGQTFTKQVDKQVLPTFISMYDDPTLKRYTGSYLNGHYRYDDEGVITQRVNLVDKGILKNFLMSRSPIKGFSESNGHGRSQAGRRPVSRQGNLVIESSQTVSWEKLRGLLVAECKKQGKPYGLYFEDITGGFTTTGRYGPQAFNVTPIVVYRIYVDGRPDELVRGVDLIGTPLTSFSKIIACGDKPGIFNGYCGAESGSVPVSAVSPPILTTQIEVQKKRKASDKPPVLPPPERKRGSK
ncbi:MAG: peptidase U62 [bacterium]|nr:peptidase U62 [bacterium]